jgi:hypothetical protein
MTLLLVEAQSSSIIVEEDVRSDERNAVLLLETDLVDGNNGNLVLSATRKVCVDLCWGSLLVMLLSLNQYDAKQSKHESNSYKERSEYEEKV